MMYRIFYGELSEARKKKWDNGEDNSLDVLAWTKEIDCMDWLAFLQSGKKYFKDELQIDWGSYAWKTDKDGILAMKRGLRAKVEDVKNLKENVEYGVVFIEEC